MAIVTISHEMGSGGSEIGVTLAERLEYRYVDQVMISEAAQRYGCIETKLAHLDETRPSFFERFAVETRLYTTVLQSAVLDVAEQDNAVIMGRAGQVLLRGIAHSLRVFVRAPYDLRVKRLARRTAAQTGETVDIRTIARMVRRDDQGKIGRMRYLFDVNWKDPALYDVVINTEVLAIEATVDAIIGLLQRPEYSPSEGSRQAVCDLALASRVRCALAAHPETRKHRITVEAERGVIRLEGTNLEHAVEVARSVPGVTDVREQVLQVPPTPPFVA